MGIIDTVELLVGRSLWVLVCSLSDLNACDRTLMRDFRRQLAYSVVGRGVVRARGEVLGAEICLDLWTDSELERQATPSPAYVLSVDCVHLDRFESFNPLGEHITLLLGGDTPALAVTPGLSPMPGPTEHVMRSIRALTLKHFKLNVRPLVPVGESCYRQLVDESYVVSLQRGQDNEAEQDQHASNIDEDSRFDL